MRSESEWRALEDAWEQAKAFFRIMAREDGFRLLTDENGARTLLVTNEGADRLMRAYGISSVRLTPVEQQAVKPPRKFGAFNNAVMLDKGALAKQGFYEVIGGQIAGREFFNELVREIKELPKAGRGFLR